MRSVRPVTGPILVLLVFSGCRTAGLDGLARREPAPAARPTLDARTVIAEHNRNAERIDTLEAMPSLSVTAGRRSYAVDGRMALERPRNFKLDLLHTGTEVADIGSNDEKFWFWLRDNKATYFCNYRDADNSALATTLQPDWIVEALGLRVIPDAEMGAFQVTRGTEPGTLVLTHEPTLAQGETVTRVTIISESTHRIREHQLHGGQPKALLARAVVDNYMQLVPDDRTDEVVYVPEKLKLHWVREKLTMEVTFDRSTTKVNVPFSEDRRAALFVQGEHAGSELRNLAREGSRPSRGPTTIRETRPAPPAGVQLGQPEPAPFGIEGAARIPRDPVALSADLPALPSLTDQLVGPAMPHAPEPEFARPSPGGSLWKRGSDLSLGR